MYETAIPMGKMLNAFLAIHGRCKFIIFLGGQTPSSSAPTLILSLMEHFQGKAKNTVKHSIKSTFSISIQLNCNWLPGNPQLPPYIYTHIYIYVMLLLPDVLMHQYVGTGNHHHPHHHYQIPHHYDRRCNRPLASSNDACWLKCIRRNWSLLAFHEARPFCRAGAKLFPKARRSKELSWHLVSEASPG